MSLPDRPRLNLIADTLRTLSYFVIWASTGWCQEFHQAFDASSPPITALAMDEINHRLVVGSTSKLSFRSWPDAGKLHWLATQLDHIHDVAISPDGASLAVAGGTPGESGTVELYRWPSGEKWRTIQGHQDVIHSVAWRSDSKIFATASADNQVRIWSTSATESIEVLTGHSRPVLATEFLSGEWGLVSAGVDESLRYWQLKAESSLDHSQLVQTQPKRTFSNHTRPIHDLALRPKIDDGPPVIASISDDSTLRLWQPTVGRMMRFVRLPSAPLAVAWMQDAKWLAVACRDGHVRIVEPDSVVVVSDLEGIRGPAFSLAIDSTNRVVIGGDGGEIRSLTIPLIPEKTNDSEGTSSK